MRFRCKSNAWLQEEFRTGISKLSPLSRQPDRKSPGAAAGQEPASTCQRQAADVKPRSAYRSLVLLPLPKL
jgi:hypothetical protein